MRKTNLYFVGAIDRFWNVQMQLESADLFSWNILRTVRDIEKMFQQKLHIGEIHTSQITPNANP